MKESQIIYIGSLLRKCRDYQHVSDLCGCSIDYLKKLNQKRFHLRMKVWTKEREQLLKEFYPVCRPEELREKLGLTDRQIYMKANSLGLKKDSNYLQEIRQYTGSFIANPKNHHNGFDKNFTHPTGEDHWRYIENRSLVKGGRQKKYYFTKEVKEKTLQNQEYKCFLCEQELIEGLYEFDHIIPVKISKNRDLSNCAVLCYDCHRSKSIMEQVISNGFQDLETLKEIYGPVAQKLNIEFE